MQIANREPACIGTSALTACRLDFNAMDDSVQAIGWAIVRDGSIKPLGAERGIITKVKVDVALECAIGVERGPAARAGHTEASIRDRYDDANVC